MQVLAALGDAPTAAIAVMAILLGVLLAARGPREKRAAGRAGDADEPGRTLLEVPVAAAPDVEPGFVGPEGTIVGHGPIRLADGGRSLGGEASTVSEPVVVEPQPTVSEPVVVEPQPTASEPVVVEPQPDVPLPLVGEPGPPEPLPVSEPEPAASEPAEPLPVVSEPGSAAAEPVMAEPSVRGAKPLAPEASHEAAEPVPPAAPALPDEAEPPVPPAQDATPDEPGAPEQPSGGVPPQPAEPSGSKEPAWRVAARAANSAVHFRQGTIKIGGKAVRKRKDD